MHATGVLGDITTNCAGNLRRWVWCIEQTQRPYLLGNRKVGHPRLDPRQLIHWIHRENPIEPRHAQQYTLGMGHGTAGQTSSCTSGNNGYLMGVTQLHNQLNLFNGRG